MGIRESLTLPAAPPAPGSPLALALMGQNPKPRPTVIQGNPRSELLARALLSNGTRGDIRSGWELAGNLAQTFAGNTLQERYLADQQARAQAAKEQEYARADALKAQERAQKEADEKARIDRYRAASEANDPYLTGDADVVKGYVQSKFTAAQKPTPYTDAGKIASDLKAGIITPEQAQVATDSLTTSKREIRSDANGIPRYVDNGKAVYGTDEPPQGEGPMFGGKSVEAQALNYLIGEGKLTKEQAAEVGAGKTVVGPNGEVIFMTPAGIVAGMPGQTPAPVVPPAAPPPTQGPSPTAVQTPSGSRPGVIQITNPKGQGTGEQMNAALYADRMRASNDIIGKLEQVGTSLPNSLMSGVPVLGNYMITPEYRQLDQAQRDFVNATLRRESGAVISTQEFDNAKKQYFPQPGDDPQTIANKRANRLLALNGISRAAGSNYQPQVPAPAPPAAEGGWKDMGNGVRVRELP